MSEEDLTTEAILEAALSAFGAHGFRATSLSQIASAARVSRPTLYARYPDKVQLFRAVLRRAYDDALAAAGAAAEGSGPFEDVLRNVLLGYYGSVFERFHGLPEIDELILVQSEEAEDVVLEARERFRKLLGRMLRRQIRRGEIDLASVGMPVTQLVDQIRLAPSALKTPTTTRAQYRRGLTNFARLMARALSVD